MFRKKDIKELLVFENWRIELLRIGLLSAIFTGLRWVIGIILLGFAIPFLFAQPIWLAITVISLFVIFLLVSKLSQHYQDEEFAMLPDYNSVFDLYQSVKHLDLSGPEEDSEIEDIMLESFDLFVHNYFLNNPAYVKVTIRDIGFNQSIVSSANVVYTTDDIIPNIPSVYALLKNDSSNHVLEYRIASDGLSNDIHMLYGTKQIEDIPYRVVVVMPLGALHNDVFISHMKKLSKYNNNFEDFL